MVEFSDEIWDELVKVARDDGTITNEEEKLLENIKRLITDYYNKLEAGNSDKSKLLEQMIDKAYSYAQQDNVITWDELDILKKLKEVAKKL